METCRRSPAKQQRGGAIRCAVCFGGCAIEVPNCKILPAAAPTGHRPRRPAACREEVLSSPDQRKDHSFFRRAIAVMAGMILRERMLNDPAAAAASQGGNLSDDQA
jgi:hypothetical protein